MNSIYLLQEASKIVEQTFDKGDGKLKFFKKQSERKGTDEKGDRNKT